MPDFCDLSGSPMGRLPDGRAGKAPVIATTTTITSRSLSMPQQNNTPRARRSRSASRFKRTEARRAIRAALDAGLPVRSVEVDPATGKINVIIGAPAPANGGETPLDNWMVKKNARAAQGR
jgi:hypothetical protein